MIERILKKQLIVIWALIILFFLSSNISYADLLPEGHRNIEYGVEIENIKDFPDHVFLLHLKSSMGAGWGGYFVINQGESISFYWPMDPRIFVPEVYAIKRSSFRESEISKVPRRAEEKRLSDGRYTSKQDELQINNYFQNNKNLIPSNIVIKPISTVKENDRRLMIVDVFKIDSLKNGKLKISFVETKNTYSKNKGFHIFWYIALPAIAVLAIMAILVFRQRAKRP